MVSLYDGFQPPPMRVLENGVDLAAFVSNPTLPPLALAQLRHPRLLYIGTFDHRIDYDFITAAARRLPNFSFVLGGPMTTVQRSRFSACNNVTLLGGIAYDQLSHYAASPNFFLHCQAAVFLCIDSVSGCRAFFYFAAFVAATHFTRLSHFAFWLWD
jgi:hypothetical protein